MKQILGSILLTVLISSAAESQTVRRVPGDFPTIQSAIAAAQPGDTVRVAPGVYVENISYLGKTITVVSEAGADVTTIDGGLSGTAVTIGNAEGPDTLLDGFTIRNGKGSNFLAGGIQIDGSPTIRHNRIVNNVACAGGVGISISSGSPTIQGNLISNNVTQGCSASGGVGIQVHTTGSTQILDNIISNNSTFLGTYGGGILVGFTGPTLIRGNIITGNSAQLGGGIGISAGYDVTITQNLIAGNSSSNGGGIYWLVPAVGGIVSVTNNTIVDNSAVQNGSAIYAEGADGASPVRNNVIIGKTGQSAIYCGNANDNNPPIFAFNDVFAAQASAYSGFCADTTGTNGNISAAPLFVDRAAQNLRLLPGSPGIDAGSNAVVGFSVDLDSFPRILPSGGTVDMGAFEFATVTTSTTSTASLTFADQNAGTVSAPSDITLTNTGTSVLLVSTLVVTGEFSQINTCQTPTGIPAGQSCTISVRFAPSVGGPRSGQLTIAGNSASSTVSLSGNGVAPVNLSTNAITFIDQRTGTTSAATILSFSNTGNAGLDISNIATTGDYTSSNDCPAVVNAGASCTISIRFAPTAMGIRFGAVTINAAGGVYIVMLSGRGVKSLINFSQANINFVNQPVGTTSAPQSVTVSNTGNIALTINSISYTGDFHGTNNCGSSLGVNATCTINVVYSPTVLGMQTGVISVSDDADGSPQTVNLSGTTNSPFLTATPTSLAFGNQAINTTSSSKTVTLRNVSFNIGLSISVTASADFSKSTTCSFLFQGSSCNVTVTYKPTSLGPKTGTLVVTDSTLGVLYTLPLSGTGVDLVFSPSAVGFGDVHMGTNVTRTVNVINNDPNPVNISGLSVSAGFSETTTCGLSLASGASCSIDISFSPVTAGVFVTGTLTMTDDAIGSPHTAPISARGVTGVVSPSPTTLAFGADLVGTTSVPQTITVKNTGSGPLTFSGIAATGDFGETNNCGTTLAVNATCSIAVTFLPTAPDSRVGSLIIMSDGSGSPNTVNLTGTGLASLPIPVISGISPDKAAVGAAGITITVSGSGFSTLSRVRWGGDDLVTTFISNSSLTAIIPAIDFAAMGTTPILVFNPQPGGGVSNGMGFVVFGTTTLTTRDLTYDRLGGRIYASVGGTAPIRANTLTPIDPATGALGTSAVVGSNPGKLAISDDSSSIYIALDGDAMVRRFDTASQLPGIVFALGSDPTYGPLYAEDIAVSPGAPETIAVSRKIPAVSPSHAGVAIYDSGVVRPVKTPGFTGSNAIEYSESPSILYGSDTETSLGEFRTMSVNASGATITSVQSNQSVGDFRYAGGRIYVRNGLVVDPLTDTVLGRFPVPLLSGSINGFVADSALARAFYLIDSGFSVQILAFDLNSLALTGTITLPTSELSSSTSGSLIRWGDAGLAFRIRTQVFTFQMPQNWLPPVPITLAISKSGTGIGTVTSVPAGIDCGAICSATFAYGQVVALSATPSVGSVFAGWSGDADCIDGNVTMSVAHNCIARFTVPPVSVDDFYRVDKGGTLNIIAPGVLSNDTNAAGNPITALQMTSTIHGSVVLNADGSFTYIHNGSDGISDSFTYKVNDGIADSNTATVTLAIDGLFVSQFQPTSGGFVAEFSRPIDASALSLYTTETGGFGPPDVTLVGNSVGSVTGSVVVSGNGGRVTFVRTGDVLPPDTYTATLRSATNGFVSSTVGMLDGNHDGFPEDNFQTTFTVVNSPAVIVSIPDFLRGPRQSVDLSGTGMPVTLSDGAGVSQVDLVLKYDPSLLLISQVVAGAGLPAGSQVQTDFSLPDRVHVTVTSAAPLSAGNTELLRIAAQVPAAAPYGASQVLAISSLSLNGGSIPAVGDDGLHVAAYIADTTGNGSYSSLDAQRILRVTAGLDTGFASFTKIDPVVVGDVTGNGALSSLDASRLLQEIVGIDRSEIPPLP